MLGLIILFSILLLITLIMLIRVKLVIVYRGNDVKLILKILGIPIKLMPKKEKKKKLRLSDYSYKAVQKRLKKEEKKKAKAAKKKKSEKEATEKPKQKKEKAPLSETISFIAELVKYLVGKFFGHLRIDMTEITILVGSDNAAKTAIMFGVINQSVIALLKILDAITNVKKTRKCKVSVAPDYTGEKIKANIRIAFSLRVWHAFSIALGALFRYVGNMIKKAK